MTKTSATSSINKVLFMFSGYMKMSYYVVQRSTGKDRRRCRGQGRFACDNCDRRYHQMKNLRRHVTNECGKQPTHQCSYFDLKYVAISKHTCVTCGKTYKHKHHLKRHHDFECGVDPKFKCAFCPHRTRYKDSLMKHILARHQHLLEQNSQYGHQQVFETHTDVEMNFHAQETNAFNVYPDFTQNL
ncbi:PREDICTED: oocyte zinc finger protein XlCOF15-like [Atta colombica]|uniref:oocyte zinc finger protein XlCOF15-like n=1 Tax=Atta colombica TaxID=520822 RepID=UPI00084CB24D|nr:PREDICTED: oocyte zinc finger protein XlCOF15-like [Atta colombica]